MTRQDYVTIALAIGRAREGRNEHGQEAIDAVVFALCPVLALDNDHFDAEQFMAATS